MGLASLLFANLQAWDFLSRFLMLQTKEGMLLRLSYQVVRYAFMNVMYRMLKKLSKCQI